ncbi:MAG: hypothetical protein M1836_006358 [Candelina mexicana]|nr:MAG: hypothetical protein M1836_006358 [Candelina mexicana]
MAPIKNVALAGAGGAIAPSILAALLSSSFNITVLTRSGSNTKLPPNTSTRTVEYTLSSLTPALEGIDAVVSTLGPTGGQQQRVLLDAAIAAGVKRFIPSSFGCDLENPKAKTLPVFKDKVEFEGLLEEKAKEGKIEYTVLYNSAFLDWGMEVNFIANVKGEGKVEIYDGGESKFSATTLAGVGKAVVGILSNEAETRNRRLRVHEAVVSQNQLHSIAKKVGGKSGEVEVIKTEDLEKFGYEQLQKGNLGMETWVAFIKRALFGEGYGGAFPKTDNEILGVGKLSDGELEEIVAKVVKG